MWNKYRPKINDLAFFFYRLILIGMGERRAPGASQRYYQDTKAIKGKGKAPAISDRYKVSLPP